MILAKYKLTAGAVLLENPVSSGHIAGLALFHFCPGPFQVLDIALAGVVLVVQDDQYGLVTDSNAPPDHNIVWLFCPVDKLLLTCLTSGPMPIPRAPDNALIERENGL